MDQQLQRFWEIESLGITDSEKSLHEQFAEVIESKEGHYCVPLPWKDPTASLPDGYHTSKRRLFSLLKRLRQTPEILQRYDRTIREQQELGIVEIVDTEKEGQEATSRVHYLPHDAVLRHDKMTTKVRVVYDASAKAQGKSLNDCLHVGEKFNQKIFDILLRFRTHPIALVADIEKAFLTIGIKREDRNVLWFLWVQDPLEEPPELQVLRFPRVVFGVASSPFLLNATIQHHLELYRDPHPQLVNQLIRSTYVDNVVSGAEAIESAFQLFIDSKRVLQERGFNLKKFITNNLELQKRIQEFEGTGRAGQSQSEKNVQLTLGNAQYQVEENRKVLGVQWNVQTDEFVFDPQTITDLAKGGEPTKRTVVGLVSKFYDPLGILSPAIVPFKIFFQELC